MGLQIRRGTNAERQSMSPAPASGELIYVTDYSTAGVSPLWIGDGSTTGGNPISLGGGSGGETYTFSSENTTGGANLKLLASDLTFQTVKIQAGKNIIVNNLSNNTIEVAASNIIDIQGSVFADDSTLIVDSVTGTLRGTHIGNVRGSNGNLIIDHNTNTVYANIVVGNTFGYHTGDVSGSIFGDDSTALIDGVNSRIVGDIFNDEITNDKFVGKTILLKGTNSFGTKAGIRIETDGNQDDPYDLLTIKSAVNGSIGPAMFFSRARSTLASPFRSFANDEILTMYWAGTDPNKNPGVAASLAVLVDQNPPNPGGIVPGRIVLSVTDPSGNLEPALTIASDSVLNVADNTLNAGANPGDVDFLAGPVNFLKIKVNGYEYALPLYFINLSGS